LEEYMRPLAALASLAALGAAIGFPSQLAKAQEIPRLMPPVVRPRGSLPAGSLDEDDRSGPRLGVAYLIGGSVTAERAGKHVAPFISLFGWQIEHQFDTGRKDLPVPMTELVLLAGGMEQGVLLPSASWLIGLRKTNGWEAGVGPTLTGAGVQLAVAAGMTHSLGALNVPVNLAIAPGRRGAAISLTTGFNLRHGS
jgi:hypothetical protein